MHIRRTIGFLLLSALALPATAMAQETPDPSADESGWARPLFDPRSSRRWNGK
jgi:hypothetical protein